MNMKKMVKKYGNSLVVTFDAEDQKIHNIEEGDILDLSDMTITKGDGKDE